MALPDPLTDALLAELRRHAGRRHVLTRARATLRYRRGQRAAAGRALAVVRPGDLVTLWRVVDACVRHGAAVVMQAANTGLTGGSSAPEAATRPVVIVSTLRLDRSHPIEDGRQVVCLPGATLAGLEQLLARYGREPHSVIGSSCIGASVIGGVCNNSGGALVRRGPSYTECALFARIGADGRLELVNRLGIELGDTAEAMLQRLERGDFTAGPAPGVLSDPEYQAHVRAVDAPTPARFNADPRRLHDASGCAGRIAVFAVRLDSFPADGRTATFWIGSDDPDALTALRRTMLAGPIPLPVAAEYLDRATFDIADRYGRDQVHAIRRLGHARLPALFAARARIDAAGAALGIGDAADRLLQPLARWLPDPVPPRLRAIRDRYAHYLILKVADAGIAPTAALLAQSPCAVVPCTEAEASAAFLHRFVAAGAAARYRAVHGGALVALDVALPRNARAWDAAPPPALAGMVQAQLHYGHFFCHVFHRDYVLKPGVDAAAFKRALLAELDAAGAEYPAEHNVGRQYRAKPALAAFYRRLDPGGHFNPGIGEDIGA